MGHGGELRGDGGWRRYLPWRGGRISQGGRGEREPGEVNRAARGLRNGEPSSAEVRARGWEPLFMAGRGCWHCHVPLIAFPFFPPLLLTPPLIKINGPSHRWPSYYQFIHQTGWDAASVAPYVAKTLTVLEQTSAQLWGKVSTSGPNKWYGLNGRGNDFYPSSLIWPGGRWRGGCWGVGSSSVLQFHTWTLTWFNNVVTRQKCLGSRRKRKWNLEESGRNQTGLKRSLK